METGEEGKGMTDDLTRERLHFIRMDSGCLANNSEGYRTRKDARLSHFGQICFACYFLLKSEFSFVFFCIGCACSLLSVLSRYCLLSWLVTMILK